MWKKHIKAKFTKGIDSLLDFIYPRFCTCCHERLSIHENILCAKCLLNLPRYRFRSLEENEITQLFWGLVPIQRGLSLFYYTRLSDYSRILASLKYANRPEIGEHMGRIMAEEFQRHGFFQGIDIIIPIPLTKKKEKQRGYNQSEWIAKGIAAITHINVNTDCVVRKKSTASQTSLTAHERIESVRGVFEVTHPDEIIGKHILLVDDVLTTGATLLSCAETIAQYPQIKISIATLARTHL
jgi:ComF family protein